MIDKNVVTRIVDEWLEGKDYFLVDVTVSPDDKIVVEIDHAEGVWIDDCVELSRYIESKLDREEEDYELEVGSAGIGQPFKVLQQYLIHIGKEVEILTKEGKKLEGVLKDANEENFTVTIEKKVKPEGAKRPKLGHDVDFIHRLEMQQLEGNRYNQGRQHSDEGHTECIHIPDRIIVIKRIQQCNNINSRTDIQNSLQQNLTALQLILHALHPPASSASDPAAAC